MISQSEGIQLIESKFPQLLSLYKKSALSSDIYKSIQRWVDFSREAVLDYNLQLSRKCFSAVNTLLSQGDEAIRTAIEKRFIYSFFPFAKKGEKEDCKNCFCTAKLFTPDLEEPDDEENECETEH